MVTRPGKPIRIPEQTARRIVNLMAASSLCLIWTLYGLWAYNLQQERMHIMTQTLERQLNVMEEHQIRRLPVIDNHRLVGIVSEADIARHLPEPAIAQFVKAICSQTAITSH